ncbi:type II secretion system protein [Rossellomorea sp. DA94]|uniref:type II secretion system protein n=1 Tax=Rossellomorea sp. DA94 TaxID=3038653 RepID=UPI00244693B6|nr:type II secretion system protein [Rossellomorea sp. DA94]WGG44157.1 type II secretion system protein [Rossellomorea sp. DA94]
MYRNTKGFSLPETLVAFSCILMMCGLFIPFFIHYASGLQKLQREVEALKFLREGVEEAIVTHEFVDHSRIYKGVGYELIWENGGSGEACVRYDEDAGTIREVCVGADG